MGHVNFSFFLSRSHVVEDKHGIKLITLISMYRLRPPVGLRHFSDPFHNYFSWTKFYRRFVYFEDTVTYFVKFVMFSHRGKQIDILKFIQL